MHFEWSKSLGFNQVGATKAGMVCGYFQYIVILGPEEY